MAALTAITQSPMHEGKRCGSVMFTQANPVEGPVFLDIGVVPEAVLVITEDATDSWFWCSAMGAAHGGQLLAGGAALGAAAGIVPINGDPASSTVVATPGGAGDLHVIRGGVDYDMDAASAVDMVIKGIKLGTTVRAGAADVVKVTYWY